MRHSGRLRPFLFLLSGLSLSSVRSQSIVAAGTTVEVVAGTTVTVRDGGTFATAPGATLLNNGVFLIEPLARLDEAPGAPFQGSGTERFERSYSTALNNEEPGGLRLVVSTVLPTGATALERGHLPITEPGGATSIARWYDWTSAVNTGLNASIAFGSDPVQLNGINETDQVLHVRQASSLWQAVPSGVDPVGHRITATGLDSLGTLTAFSGALTTAVTSGSPADAPFLFPTVSSTDVQVIVPEGLTTARWTLVDGLGRVVPVSAQRKGDRWSTLEVAHLAPGSYHLLINGRSAGRFIRP